MNKEKIHTVASLIICIIGGCFIFFVFLRHVLSWLLPFLIAWGVAFAMRRPAKVLCAKTHIPEKLLRVILSVSLIAAILSFGGLIIWQLIDAIWRFLSDFGEGGRLSELFSAVIDSKLGLAGRFELPYELKTQLNGALSSLVTSLLSAIAGGVTKWISSIPRFFISVVITFIATVYFAFGLENVNSYVQKLLPERIFTMLVKIKNGFLSVGLKYIRSYSLIIFITFAIMLTGFLILRIPHAAVIALLVAFLDVLPVIGVGTILVPWSVFSFISGNHFVGIGLIVLFLANEFIRQLTEPKIIGKNLDMHPLLTLFIIYAGYGIFGFAGLLLLPIAAVFINLIFKKENTPEVE